MNKQCTYAYPGTYGHECGRTALFAALMSSKLTKSGIYFGRRCLEHKDSIEPYDSPVIRVESFDEAKHINDWK
jgi:hypothetical protein